MANGNSRRLGAVFDAANATLQFRVYSHNATRIELALYALPRGPETWRTPLQRATGDVWTATLDISNLKRRGLQTPFYYGLRVWGPNWTYDPKWVPGSTAGFVADVDGDGNRFNPNKLLIDPYTLELSHDPAPALICPDPNGCSDEFYGEYWRAIDTGSIAPKSMAVLPDSQTPFGDKPQRRLKDDVIYEVHLRGFTASDPSVPAGERGTYKGAARKARYLKELGVTAIELLPVQEFADEQNDDGDPRGDNYWGYMTLAYFAPNRRYAADKTAGGPTREFREMVAAFHAEGIKVFLDVVYNHTGEGLVRRDLVGNAYSNAACLLSLAGLDNACYYLCENGKPESYLGYGGCGGNLSYGAQVVQNLIVDSLQYWADVQGVDGFRFDLAPILGMVPQAGSWAFDGRAPLLEAIRTTLPARELDAVHGCDLIAEPWGGPDCKRNDFSPEWALWNDSFRDTVKKAENQYGASGDLAISSLSKSIAGSSELIAKKPWNSINYVISHDDCNALSSVFAYDRFCHLMTMEVKTDQLSWSHNGDVERQKKAVRNTFTLLMLSAGVPMFAGGDELFRRIPPHAGDMGCMDLVALDVPAVYLDWSSFAAYQAALAAGDTAGAAALLARDDLAIYDFVRQIIAFRNLHPCLRPEQYFSGATSPVTGLKDISWHAADAGEIQGTGWDQRDFLGYRIDAQLENTTAGSRLGSIYVAYNRSPGGTTIQLPISHPPMAWCRLLDTGSTDPWLMGRRYFDGGNTAMGASYDLQERSILVAIEKPPSLFASQPPAAQPARRSRQAGSSR
jgi:isoamylase